MTEQLTLDAIPTEPDEWHAWLCFPCNRKLPYDASPEWLRAAVAYLEDPPIAA